MQVLTLMPFLVWYVLPGLNLITVCVVVPALGLNLHGAAAVFSVEDLIGAVVLAVVIGFTMDSVKLYRWSPRYKPQKEQFQARMASALEISTRDVPKIFEVVRADVRTQEGSSGWSGTIELDHSRWVMINHTSKTFFLGAAVWLGIGLAHMATDSTVNYIGLLLTRSLGWQLVMDGVFMGLCFAIGWRMQGVAYDAADTSDMNYLIYVRRNAVRLKGEIAGFLVEGDPTPEG